MISYRLSFSIHDDQSETPHEALYRSTASIDVATLQSVGDRTAFDWLAEILRSELVPGGSTVIERREIASRPDPHVPYAPW